MAWRLNESVVRGEIDNRERGRVIGQVWLLGREEPVRIELEGNCYRDLAGCRLEFRNPSPKPGDHVDLAGEQKGVVGDMTASRKVRVPDVPFEEMMRLSKAGRPFPEHKANCLYLEWFSEFNGRVVIESVDYRVRLSPPTWTLSPEEDLEQRQANQQAMVDWMQRLGEALAPSGQVQEEDLSPNEEEQEGEEGVEDDDEDDDEDENEEDVGPDKPMDEFEWEKFLRESDARTDKFGQLYEKYIDHPDRDKIIAKEMGWTWLQEALAAQEPGELGPEDDVTAEPEEPPELAPNPLTEGIDWVRDEHGDASHPLVVRSHKLSMEMWHYCQEGGLLEDSSDPDVHHMVFEAQITSAKLAGALNHLAYEEDPDAGFIIACLKRSLPYLNKAIGASDQVGRKKLIDAEHLAAYRTGLFGVREEILALMERFRKRM